MIAHGTYIGTIRLDTEKPQQVPIDSEIHFGASTRRYVIRERPQTMQPTMGDEKTGEEIEGGLLGLPETETELDVGTSMIMMHVEKKKYKKKSQTQATRVSHSTCEF